MQILKECGCAAPGERPGSKKYFSLEPCNKTRPRRGHRANPEGIEQLTEAVDERGRVAQGSGDVRGDTIRISGRHLAVDDRH